MRVSYEWLKEFVDIAATPGGLAERLTMTGFEVEGTESVDGDIVFEVNVTPNRPDCLSMIGVAREVSAAFRIPFKIPLHEIKEKLPVSEFSVEVLDPMLCNRYTGRVIKNVRIADTPEWMKKRLEKCGIRSVNNIVDITNYVLLEFGHPLHAFDADTLKGGKVIVATPDSFKKSPLNPPLPKGGTEGVYPLPKGRADEANSVIGTKIKTLDGVEREIPSGTLLIWDAEKPIAVAGVMGGSETEVTEKTKNIFLESAYFDPFSVRKTSKKIGLVSESSYRFERGTDIEFLEKALNRAALMIQEIAGGTIHKIIDVYPVKYVPEPVRVKYERINRMLGINLSQAEMLELLERLGLRTETGKDVFDIFPLSHRRDLKRESDVAEEVARIFGYENIPVTNPKSPLSSGRLNRKTVNINIVRETMRKAGFTEAINYSFMSIASLDMIGIPDSDRRRKTIAISNPLSQDECLLRTTLMPALIGNLKYNLDRGMKDIRIFEISKVFVHLGENLPSEELRLGGIFYREKYPSFWKEDTRGFFITKGALGSLFEELKISAYSFLPSSEPFLHSGQASDIYVSDSCIGSLGVMAPAVVDKLDLKKQKPEIVLFELNLDLLLTWVPDSIQYRPIPKYPSVERDIAIVVDETIPSAQIQETIRSFPSELIEDISVFDYFKGENIPEGRKSLAFNIIYRANDRTLRDEEVEELHTSLVAYIIEKTGGELRR
jgi:phenylalanyl-tRNA synthetase beta chain